MANPIQPSAADSTNLATLYSAGDSFAADLASIAPGEPRYPEPINRSISAISEWIDEVGVAGDDDDWLIDAAHVHGALALANIPALDKTKLANDAVETLAIKDLNVTTGKLAEGAATRNKLGTDLTLAVSVADTATVACTVQNTYYDVPGIAFDQFTPTVDCRAILTGSLNVACSAAIAMSYVIRDTEGAGSYKWSNIISGIPADANKRTIAPILGYIDLTKNVPYTLKLQIANNSGTNSIDTRYKQLCLTIVPREV